MKQIKYFCVLVLLAMMVCGCASVNFGNVSTEISCASQVPGLYSVNFVLDQDLNDPSLFDKEDMLFGFKLTHKNVPKGIFGMRRLINKMQNDQSYVINGKTVKVKSKSFSGYEIIDRNEERLAVHTVCKSIDFSSIDDIVIYLQEVAKRSEFVFDADSASIVQIITLRDRKEFDVSLRHIGKSSGYLGLYLSRIYLNGMPIPPGVLRHEVSSRVTR